MPDDMKTSRILKRFGRYLILDHLVDGGMAKICRARFLGEQADKIVAIKMVQSQFSKDPSFAKMFMDEIKVTFGLIHPNIAQTYDTGMIDDQLFAAMEYVDGKNLKQFLDRLKERSFVFPIEISIYIVSQICQALNYAHNFTDKLSGKQFNIIHRDISPHNVMITYDGTVKVIDFGIAKADNNGDATQAGTIKGKLSYLAPEYLEGKELDHRYDQFAVGITLWELLCSRKLFKAPNELAVLKLVQACKIPPPSSINPNVPKELDEIVLKVLSKDREQRFGNMDQFNRALVKLLYSKYPDFNPTDLSFFAKELFKDEIRIDRDRLYDFGKIDIDPFVSDMKEELSNPPKKTITPKADKPKSSPNVKRESNKKTIKVKGRSGQSSKKRESGGLVFENDVTAGSLIINEREAEDNLIIQQDSPPSSTSSDDNDNIGDIKNIEDIPNMPQVKVGETIVNKGNSGNLFATTDDGNNTSPSLVTIKPPKKSKNSKTSKFDRIIKDNLGPDDLNIGKPNQASTPMKKIITIAILIAAGAYFGGFTNFNDRKPASKMPSVKVVKEETKTRALGMVTFTNTNPYQSYYIDNKEVFFRGLGLEVPLNKQILVKVKQDSRETFEVALTLDRHNKSAIVEIPKMKKIFFGEIISDYNFHSGDTLILYQGGDELKEELPLKSPIRVPAGTYKAKIINNVFQTKKDLQIIVEADKRFLLKK